MTTVSGPRWRQHSNSGVNHLVRPTRVNSDCGRASAMPWGPVTELVASWNEPSDNPLARCTHCLALENAYRLTTVDTDTEETPT